jgi:hypothetical protein
LRRAYPKPLLIRVDFIASSTRANSSTPGVTLVSRRRTRQATIAIPAPKHTRQLSTLRLPLLHPRRAHTKPVHHHQPAPPCKCPHSCSCSTGWQPPARWAGPDRVRLAGYPEAVCEPVTQQVERLPLLDLSTGSQNSLLAGSAGLLWNILDVPLSRWAVCVT